VISTLTSVADKLAEGQKRIATGVSDRDGKDVGRRDGGEFGGAPV
jgi:hypothetical protein